MNFPTYPVTSAIPLQDQDYAPYIFEKIDSAKIKIWASIFIVDARVDNDEFRSVRTLIEKLSYAAWRNVDVRVIIGTATIVDVYLACLTSAYYMKKQGINVRTFTSQDGRESTHSKYVIFDNSSVIVGSSNWTHRSFNQSVNSSLAMESTGLSSSLSLQFDNAWQVAAEVTYEG